MLRNNILTIILLLISVPLNADSNVEFSVKSAFMLKMTHFIDWPESSLINDESQPDFTICIEHEHGLTNGLQEWAKKNRIKNKAVKIEYFYSGLPTDLSCNIVYITSKKLRKRITGHDLYQDVLTISDISGSAEAGVLINFIKIDNKLRFEINLKKANAAGFKISPRLLRLAKIVEGGR